ncbi:plasmid partitioning protein RepB [Aminobacter sp. MDW-2]|uniref:plasmid partitioning protein RepB n=1 Tax=Aminobacter sp. MDW-2 TaxID=2666139 RepID=UPI0012AF0E26|nr:plasmid partitioning protein RepB [Aminobacter sp. MDW-2]MRX36927.1 plasmid partitioning protein RepB [Aminobacter sp. MDW-2]QNH37948.1 plasmid partitioning protein RepB [Aminobacter sp. MDW-2]
MARKNLIGISSSDETPTSPADVRPIAGFVPPKARSAPIGGITRTLGNITQKFERAQDIEKQLAEGKLIVELDPVLVDGSFISDRLGMDPAELGTLVDQIREHGQQVPILVRPHPAIDGRYQVAYGHRRLAAVRQLGLRVKAVIRELSDDQLVVSQGQENNARTDLSYIERALFASRLEDRSFERDVIMAALNVDKAALSKMISVVRQIPIELIEAIGAAPQIGRRRWMELAEKLASTHVELKRILGSLSADNSSDQRFQDAFDALTPAMPIKETPRSKPWEPADGSVSVTVRATSKKAVVTYEAKDGPSFATYIAQRLDDLYEAFRKSERTSTGV